MQSLSGLAQDRTGVMAPHPHVCCGWTSGEKIEEELGVADTRTTCCGAYQEDTGVENDGDRCGAGALARARVTGTGMGA